MKVCLFLFLAAGPLVLWGQRTDTARWLTTVPHQVFGARQDIVQLFRRDSVRLMEPDGMPCVVALRVNDRMVIRFEGNGDKMPNGWRPPVARLRGR